MSLINEMKAAYQKGKEEHNREFRHWLLHRMLPAAVVGIMALFFMGVIYVLWTFT